MPKGWVRVMVLNATFSNISAISWRQSALLLDETGLPRENHRPIASHKSHLYRVYHTISGIRTYKEYLSLNHNHGHLLIYRTPTSTLITWKATCSRNDIATKMFTWLLTKITHYLRRESCTCEMMMIWLIFGVLTPVSTIFQLYHGDQF